MEELENWDQVATWDGYIGYIEKSSVSDIQNLNMDREAVGESYTYLTMDQPVNLVWHQVMSTDANAGLSEAIQNMTGVNVISPTWFYVTDNNGNIINNATADLLPMKKGRRYGDLWTILRRTSVLMRYCPEQVPDRIWFHSW